MINFLISLKKTLSILINYITSLITKVLSQIHKSNVIFVLLQNGGVIWNGSASAGFSNSNSNKNILQRNDYSFFHEIKYWADKKFK